MNSEIFEKAQSIIDSRRQKAVQQNEERIREINDKIPQIREINNELFNTGKQLISLIGSHDPNVAARVEQMKRYNLQAQKMSRDILVKYGLPADYLDLHYHCEKCSDTGYRNGEICECMRQICGKLAADEFNKNSQVRLSTFDTFSLGYYSGEDRITMQKIFEFAKKYADDFPNDKRSIFMSGRTGLGKTHLSLAIAERVLSKGFAVVYDSAINILRKIEKEHFSRNSSAETIDTVLNAELLILDDLGTEYETPFYKSTIYNIINSRLNSGKQTIISTNLNFEGISKRYDERIVSRIVSSSVYCDFKGEDIRLQKRKD